MLAHPEELIKKKPFTRGSDSACQDNENEDANVGETVTATLPDFSRKIISQARYLAELDPACHDVLFDDNIPSITAKVGENQYVEIKFRKLAIPFQKMILNKKVQHLCTYDIQFTLDNSKPSEKAKDDFALFKKYWKRRNQGGMRTKLVRSQLSCGDGGLLFYFDRNDHIKSRLLSYKDGYVICSHNDDNGDRLLECVYYKSGEDEYIDVYSDKNQWRLKKDAWTDEKGNAHLWAVDPEVNGVEHGFEEIPLVTKRGDVAWEQVQELIEVYEVIYNIFIVIQKRHGWGILYIKGTFSEHAKKLAGSVILNDTTLNKDGSAQYLTPPSPQGTIDTLNLMEESIQKGAGATFILPKDLHLSGDVSGVAVQIAQSLDNEEALAAVGEWQNVADKMTRLFKYGLSKELVKKGDKDAVTRFSALEIMSTFKVWQPRSETEYNTMLETMKANGILSRKTAVEKNTESSPDEEIRIATEEAEAEEKAAAQQSANNTSVGQQTHQS
ncbi:MAG: phage portal protein [Lachnospiraceae bacterium]|nr:phage portal protein [Lachnospiraceae bacterium]